MKQRGFTLLEVLVAFTLMAVLFGALFEVFAGGLAISRKGEARSHAALLAQSKLAELLAGTQFASGSRSGYMDLDLSEVGDTRYRWTLEIDRYRGDDLGETDRGPMVPYTVTLRLSWEEDDREQKLELSTLVLGKT